MQKRRRNSATVWRRWLARLAVGVVVVVFVGWFDRWAQDDSAPSTAPSLAGSPWQRRPAPVDSVSDVLPELEPDSAWEPDDAVIELDGLALIAERRQRYRSTVSAGLAVRHLLEKDPGPDVVGRTGLYELRVDCPDRCHEVLVARGGSTVILLTPLTADPRAQEALVGVAERYTDVLPGERGPVEPTVWWVRSGLALGVLVVLVAPFLFWQVGLAAGVRAYTPHRHHRSGLPPPYVVDVCAEASAARRRSRLLFAAQLSVFLVLGALAANAALLGVAALATPVAWLVGRVVMRPKSGAGDRRRWTSNGSVGPTIVTVVAWPLAAVLLVVGGSAAADAVFGPEPERAQEFELEEGLPIGGIPFIVVGLMLLSLVGRFNRRWRISAARARVDSDSNASLLYLRAFEDDQLTIISDPAGRRPLNELFTLRLREPYEEAVVWELSRLGPVVAIAEPGTSLLAEPLGATREQVPESEWQEVVRRRISKADLIVAAIGRTPGLSWEIDHLVRNGHLDRFVLVVPPDTAEQISNRWQVVETVVVTAGGPPLAVAVDPACVLAARLQPDGRWRVAIADRRDEAAYRAAVGVHVRAALASSRTGEDKIEPVSPRIREPSLAKRTASTGRVIIESITHPSAATEELRAQFQADVDVLRADLERVLTDARQRTQPLVRALHVAVPERRGGNPAIAARWRRLLGCFIDAFLFAMVGTLIYVAGGPLWVALVIESIYVIGCVHVWGRTLGKLIVGTLVVTTDDGGRPNWRASVLRWAPAGWAWGLAPTDSIVVDVLRAVAVIVVYFPVLRDPDGRGVHDQLAGTIVLRARQ